MQLLDQIWGDGPGKRVVLQKKGGQKTGGRNAYFRDNESAFAFIRERNAAGYEVWFSCGLFGDKPGTKKSNLGNPDNREKENCLSVKSFWLDIDVGDDKPYATVDEAAQSLATFCDRLALPLPTLVSSGNGLHAHWIVDQRLDRERWEKSASALKNACARLGLKPGPERTADIASVLRIPGTIHLKDPVLPKQVELIGEIQPAVALGLFEQAVSAFIVINNARVANKVFETNLPQLPYDAEKIAAGCAVVGEMRSTHGCVSEPVWYGVLQVLSHCVDGESFAHEWSDGYEGYSYQGTEEKFLRASEFGPTLCNRFAEYEPDKCKACPHNGRITTPLQLGATLTPVVIRPTTEVQQPNNDDPQSVEGRWGSTVDRTSETETDAEPFTPSYIAPPHYEIGAQGVYYKDDEADKRIPILDVPLWVSQLTDTVREADMEATLEWVTRVGRHRRHTMRVDVLMDMRSTGMWLASRGLTGFSPRGLEAVKNYIWACIQVYQHTRDVDTVYERFGWSDKGFVIGDDIITPTSTMKTKIASRVPTKMRKHLVEKGTVEGWARATKWLDDPKYLPHQFTLIATLGSVLFYLMGVQGAVLSLAGDSGVGKTTIGSFGCSAFGNPKALEISPQSTEKAFHELWYVAGNLPVLINEAATLDLFKLSSLIYAAANGQARSTLTRSSELRESDGWQLLTIFTSNQHLLSLDEKWLNEANRRRILEFTLSKSEHNLDRNVAVALHRSMAEHYGCAGRFFLKYVVENKAEIATLLQTSYDLYAKGDVDEEHRFLLWMIGVARVAGIIAQKIDIVRFDTQPCYEWAVAQVKAQASAVLTPEQKGDDMLADYIAEHQRSFSRFIMKQAMWNSDVFGECAGRYTQHEDGSWSLMVPIAKFTIYARERGLDKQHLKRWLKDREVLTKSGMIVPLSSPMKVYQIPIKEGLNDA